MWHEPRLLNLRDECTEMLSLYHSICLCLSRLQHTIYCIVKIWQEPRLFNSRDECTVMRSLYHSICLCLSRLQHTIYCIVKIWHEPRLFNSRGECTVMLSAGQQDGGPRAVEACFLSVSYTHLTLPTMAVV